MLFSKCQSRSFEGPNTRKKHIKKALNLTQRLKMDENWQETSGHESFLAEWHSTVSYSILVCIREKREL